MLLSRLVAALEEAGVVVRGSAPDQGTLRRVGVSGVQHDSRRVSPGDLFVAWAGDAHDAHDHLGAAAAAGAAAAIVERVDAGADLPQIPVDNARRAAAVAAALAAGSPARKLRICGLTGTNGKTTSALLLRGILARGGPAAAVGTLGVIGADGGVVPGTEGLTTPGPVEMAAHLAELVRQGVRSAVLETSSHALDQHRLDGVRFDAMGFTNLSRDHLDYHGTRERYLSAKARLLELGKEGAVAVINADDPAWRALRPRGRAIAYGIDDGRAAGPPRPRERADRGSGGLRGAGDRALPDVRAERLRHSSGRTRFALVADLPGGDARSAEVDLPLAGRFNVANALCAAACALGLGMRLDEVAAGLTGAAPVPGRCETIARDPVHVMIDFAHTADALDNVLSTLRPLVAARLLVVFGAGGDRDPVKRPAMGAAVARHADVALVTSDNPRTEDPAAIVEQVAAGARGGAAMSNGTARHCQVIEIVDREQAIARALQEARPGDSVLLAGKGHEAYQVVGRERRPFDERAIVRDHMPARTAP